MFSVFFSSCLDVLRTHVNAKGAAVAVLLKEGVVEFVYSYVRPYHAPPPY